MQNKVLCLLNKVACMQTKIDVFCTQCVSALNSSTVRRELFMEHATPKVRPYFRLHPNQAGRRAHLGLGHSI